MGGRISAYLDTLWNTTATVSATKTTRWNIPFQLISKIQAVEWNTSARRNAAYPIRWNVTVSDSSNQSIDWNTFINDINDVRWLWSNRSENL